MDQQDRARAERPGVAEQRARGSHRRRAPRVQHGPESAVGDDALRRAMDLLTAEARYAVKEAERTAKASVSP